MAELSLLVSCDCGYRDVREGVKAHQKTCDVSIVSAQRHTTAVHDRGELDLALHFRLYQTFILPKPFF